jgi:hypothetical protein
VYSTTLVKMLCHVPLNDVNIDCNCQQKNTGRNQVQIFVLFHSSVGNSLPEHEPVKVEIISSTSVTKFFFLKRERIKTPHATSSFPSSSTFPFLQNTFFIYSFFFHTTPTENARGCYTFYMERSYLPPQCRRRESFCVDNLRLKFPLSSAQPLIIS